MSHRLILATVDSVDSWSATNLQLLRALRGAKISSHTASEIAFAAAELTRNALQHAGGGQLTASWSPQETGGTIEVVVTDRGRGIAGLAGTLPPARYGAGLKAAAQVFTTLRIANRPASGVQALACRSVSAPGEVSLSERDFQGLEQRNLELEKDNARLMTLLCDLEDTMHRKCQFIVRMCGDLRAPLNSIVASLDRATPPNSVAAMVDRIRQRSTDMLGLLDQLAEFGSPAAIEAFPELRHCQKYGFYGPSPFPGEAAPD